MAGRYRVWIVRYESRQPDAWHDVPPGAIAVEPAERGTMSGRHARRYVEAFNRAAQAGRRKIWAVAVPVAVRYLGDPRPGETVAAGRMKKARYWPVRYRPVTGFHRGNLPDASVRCPCQDAGDEAVAPHALTIEL